jgi:hypothetical protein
MGALSGGGVTDYSEPLRVDVRVPTHGVDVRVPTISDTVSLELGTWCLIPFTPDLRCRTGRARSVRLSLSVRSGEQPDS